MAFNKATSSISRLRISESRWKLKGMNSREKKSKERKEEERKGIQEVRG